ncbi:M1 family aminopeptidase [Nocardioides campestrisoli]|uniref:M1 family aminopeptidase n=1 Tax=Nocardioides campestrisoli TaxID=2736757 RepID=UPI0015E78A71|nr:M1 family aminopeptidase [Nocardioides campestrisoli]
MTTKSIPRHGGWRRAAARTVPFLLVAGGLVGTATAPTQAADAVDGAQTAGDAIFPHVGNGGYDALHYDVDIAWDANGVVDGYMTGEFRSASATMRARTTGAPLRSFSLDFEGLQVDAVTVDGVPATYQRVQDAEATKFKLVVTPATPVDGEFTTVVSYSGVPQHHVDADGSWEGWTATSDGAIFMGQPIGAMAGIPHNNTPGDKATWTFSLDVPSTLTSGTGTGPAAAVSNGELADKQVSPDGERTTWEWVQREQMASELALITVGKYDVIESEVTLSSGRVIPEWSFMDSSLSEANKTTIRNRRALLGEITRRFERIYGPYPGNSTGVVVDTVPSGINYALETQDRSFFPSAGSVAGNTLLHEVVHQWYGDAVSPGLWTDIWINEGMASWGPTYYNQVLAAPTPNTAAVENTYFTSWSNKAANHPDWTTPPGAQTDPAKLYGYQTYTRGALFWEALRTALRDEDFLAVVRQWQARYGGQSRRGDDLKALAEEISGHDLDAFWQDWILDADKPAWPAKYDVSLASTHPQGTVAGGTPVTYTLTAANTGKVPLSGAEVTVDLADVLDDATLGALPAGVTRTGTTLTWQVPATAVGASASVAVPVTTGPGLRDDVFATAAPATLGGECLVCGGLESAPRPTLSGTPTVGTTLTGSVEGWPAGTTFDYEWSTGGTPVEGATGATYTPVAADLGRALTLTVTGTAPGYAPTSRSSAPAEVAPGALGTSPTPTISGPTVLGGTLLVEPGDWGAEVATQVQWLRDGAVVPGATETSYPLGVADVGARLSVQVTGSRPGYASVTRTSAPTAAVTTQRLTRGKVRTVGKAEVGRVLRARVYGFDAGVALTYTWYARGQEVRSGARLPLTRALARKRIRVAVTASKPGHTTVTVRSKATAKVTPKKVQKGKKHKKGRAGKNGGPRR